MLPGPLELWRNWKSALEDQFYVVHGLTNGRTNPKEVFFFLPVVGNINGIIGRGELKLPSFQGVLNFN